MDCWPSEEPPLGSSHLQAQVCSEILGGSVFQPANLQAPGSEASATPQANEVKVRLVM